ncbi:hypothetical protein HYV10_02920 [Candidatus Dependentiae bacterium]|nr:hypothetical protein [Candidatus Dependentiae bacterium]
MDDMILFRVNFYFKAVFSLVLFLGKFNFSSQLSNRPLSTDLNFVALSREKLLKDCRDFVRYPSIEDLFYNEKESVKPFCKFRVEFVDDIESTHYSALHDAVTKKGMTISDVLIGDGYKKRRVVLEKDDLLSSIANNSFDFRTMVTSEGYQVIAFVKNNVHIKIIYFRTFRIFLCDVTKRDDDPLDI